ncbi:hypothetical protein HON86_01330 [Candidatus Woesearchaeota archaeon]|jgi:hypothetical protein|nr:hypothetical protein [Candidatus Woesearchaeota archaeon]MBT4835243.1 hypothetical protein [Candidatus Woesearchaeota archaeon]MBT6735102.1 hypothetical protein [Candidatus Woesearchaeota archaeon]MBT7169529.1 hypothetical protein [Candidatus Woesearchaeota archaeon]MBT7474381.1 hypothetical protein [Candidatus Woesearchaeota archaeon]
MNKPIKQYKSGAISSSIWANERDIDGNKVEFKTVSLRKSWKDDKNIWRDSTINLRRSDISKAILVLQKANEDLLLDDDGVKDE